MAARIDFATAFNTGVVPDYPYTIGASTPVASSTISRRAGGYSAELGKVSGSQEYFSLTLTSLAIAGSFSRGTVVLYVYFQSLPSSISPIPISYFNFLSTNIWRAGVGYRRDTGQFCFYTYDGVSGIAGSGVGPTVVTGQWYRLEFSVDFSTTTWTLSGGVATDDTPLTDMGSTTLTVAAGAAGAISPNLVFGEQDAMADAWTINYSDIGFSAAADAYPIGPIKVLGYPINGVGTHNTDAQLTSSTSVYFFTDDGTTSTGLSPTDSTSYQYIDEVPMGSDALHLEIKRNASTGTTTGSIMPNGCAGATSISSFTNPTLATGSPSQATGSAFSTTNSAQAAPAKRGSATLELNTPDLANYVNVTAIEVLVRLAVSTSGVTGSTVQIDLYNSSGVLIQSGTAQAANNTTFLDFTQNFTGFAAMNPTDMRFRITVSKGNSSTALTFAIDAIQGDSITADTLTSPGASQYFEYNFADEGTITDAPLVVRPVYALTSEISGGNAVSGSKLVSGTNTMDIFSFVNYTGGSTKSYYSAGFQYAPGSSGQQLSIDKTNNIQNIGTSTGQTQIGQQFTNLYATSTMFADFWVAKSGSPTDGLTAELWTDNGGGALAIPNTLVASSSTTIAASKLNTGPTKVTFAFSGLSLTAGTRYWIVVKRTGSGDNTNFYKAYMTTGSGGNFAVSLGESAAKTTTTWSNLTSIAASFCSAMFGTALSVSVLNGLKFRWGPGSTVTLDSVPELQAAYLEAAFPISVASVFTDSATLSTKTAITSSDVAAYVGANVVSGVTTPSATETTQYVESNTVAGVTTPSGTDVYQKAPTVDAATISSASSVSSVENEQAVDAATISSVSSVSALESSPSFDSATISSKTTPTGTDVSAFVDAQMVSSVTTPSGVDTAQFVDSSTAPDTTTVVSAIEGARLDAATISSVTTPSGTDTFIGGGTDYLDSATVSSTTSLSSVESHEIPDSATVSGTTSPSSSDILAAVDAATISTTSSITSSEVTSLVDAATVSSKTAITTVDVSSYVDAATPSSVTSPGFADVVSDRDSATIAGTTTVAFTEVTPPDSGTISTSTSLTSSEQAQYVDSALVEAVTTVQSSESKSSGLQDADTAASSTSIVSAEIAQYVESSVIESDTDVSGSDLGDVGESATVSTQSSVISDDISAYVDVNTVSSKTAVSTSDIGANTDSGAISGVSTPSGTEITGYVDTATISTKTAVTADEQYSTSGQDTSTVASKTTPSSSDVAGFVDSGTVAGSTTVGGSEFHGVQYVDSGTISSATTVTPVEVYEAKDVASINTATTVQSVETITVGDVGLPSSVTSVLSTETSRYVDSDVVASVTTFTYSEVYEPPDILADSATIATVTTVSGVEVSFIVGAFNLVGSLRERWTASALVGRFSSSIRQRWFAKWMG